MNALSTILNHPLLHSTIQQHRSTQTLQIKRIAAHRLQNSPHLAEIRCKIHLVFLGTLYHFYLSHGPKIFRSVNGASMYNLACTVIVQKGTVRNIPHSAFTIIIKINGVYTENNKKLNCHPSLQLYKKIPCKN